MEYSARAALRRYAATPRGNATVPCDTDEAPFQRDDILRL